MKDLKRLSVIIVVIVLIAGLYVFLGCNSNPLLGVGTNTDTVVPNYLEITSHSDADYVSSSFTLSGSCSDNTKVTRVTIAKKGSSTTPLEATVGEPDSNNDNKQTWTVNVTSTFLGMSSGEVSLIVTAYDAAKNSTKVTIALKIDTTIPVITVTDPTLKPLSFLNNLSFTKYEDLVYYQNGIFYIKGTIDDAYAIYSVSVKLFAEGHISAGEEKLTMSIVKDKTTYAISNSVTPSSASSDVSSDGTPSKWSFQLNATNLISDSILTDDTKYLVKVETEDMAGNSAIQSTNYLYIYEAADKPHTTISSPTAGSSTFPQSIANGNCYDDDGLSKVYWFVTSGSAPSSDYTSWGEATSDTMGAGVFDLSSETPGLYSWLFTTPAGTGTFTVYIRPVDKNGVAASSNTTVTYTQKTSTKPEIQITGPDTMVIQTGSTITVSTRSIGAASNVSEVWYKAVSGKHDSGWLVLSDATGDFTAGPLVDVSFDLTTDVYVSSTYHSITVSVYCVNASSEKSSNMSTTILADDGPPSLSVTSPSASATINGDQTITGTCSDWSVVSALYISYFENLLDAAAESTYSTKTLLDAASVGTATKNKWYKITEPSTSWLHTYKTTVITSGTSNNYHFHVAAVDGAGNISFTHRLYNINQDLDKPLVAITQPGYTGSASAPWTTVSSIEKFGQSFLIMGTSSDDDGVANVQLDIYLMDYTGGGHSVNSTIDTSADVVGTGNWSYSVENAPVCTSSQYYMVIPYVEDINGRKEVGATSYYIVSNEIPVIDIMWPSTLDPDKDTRYNSTTFSMETVNDAFGTVISNVKDDMFWDNNTGDNHLYLSDDAEYFFGWDNDVSNDDTNNDGIPDHPAVVCSDFDENTLGIFDSDVGADGERANYFRMIFRGKDPNAGGDIRKIEISYDGGSNWTTAWNWNGSALVSQDTNKYAAKSGTDSEGYTWFFADVDTSLIGASQLIKVRVTDNNNPTPYFSISSVHVSTDNTDPSGLFVSWGTSDPLNKKDFNSTNSYLGGNATDIDAGIRNVKLYFWDNQGTPDVPSYDSGTGALTAAVSSGTYLVDIPNLDVILPEPGDPADNEPDYMVRGNMYTAGNWRILDIYSDINTKYSSTPIDGIKLACLEVTDNAGNINRTFKEFQFSQYPPSHDSTNMWWNSMASGDKIALPGETTSDRTWISGNLRMDGSVTDGIVGDPKPGINKITVYIKSDDGATTYATWSTASEITPSVGLPYSGTSAVTWTLAAQDTSTINGGADGNYLMVVEVQDKVGVLTTKNQYVYIDNTAPSLVVSHPTNNFAVTGDFKIDGTGSDAGGYNTSCIKIEILNGGLSTSTEWTVTPDGSNNWSQWWDTSSPAAFDSAKITFTDKAKNTTVISRNISLDGNPPHFTSYSVTDPDGAATSLTYSTFTDLYSIVSGHDVHIVHDNLSFGTTIVDDSNITDAGVYFSGELQSDGSTYPSSGSDYTQFTNHAGTSITNTTAKNTLSSGEYSFRAWIEQQSGAVEVNLKKYFIVDEQKPHIWLVDMVATDVETDAGHIDVGLDSNGESDGDDDVSGVIKVFVKVFDNYLVRDVRVRCTNIDFGSGAGSWVTIAERNTGTGAWTDHNNGSLGDVDYWSCSKTAETLVANDNSMTLVFTFNTADVINVAGLNKLLDFEVSDMAGNLSDEAGQSSEQSSDPSIDYQNPDTNYQKIARKSIDIVPYITQIERDSSTYNTNRSKYGKYPVQQGETGITMSGYNLAQTGTNWVRVYNTAGTSNDTVSISGAGSPFTSMTMSFAAVTHSGWLRLATNAIEATNNVNTNTLDTNKEDDGSGISSTNWNDDRYMSVWETGDHFFNSDDVEYPSMSMTSTGTLYGSWGTYASSTIYYATTSARTEIFYMYDPGEFTDLFIDSNNALNIVFLGNYYGGSGWSSSIGSGGALSIWNGDKGVPSINTYTGSGTAPPYQCNRSGKYNYFHRGEMMYHDQMLLQFRKPRIIRNGDNMHVVYYDYDTKSVKYQYVSANNTNNSELTWVNLDGGQDGDDSVIVGTGRSASAGIYTTIALDENNYPVIMYYDITNQTLKLAYSNSATPTAANNWTLQTVFQGGDPNRTLVGRYITMKMDATGNIYAACNRTSTGDLIYLYAADADGTDYTFGTSTIIDSAGAVGTWGDIALNGTTPYISYLNNSMSGTYDGLKQAYYDTSISNWEYEVIPAASTVSDKRTNIEYGGVATRTTAIGYASDTFDIVYSKPEE